MRRNFSGRAADLFQRQQETVIQDIIVLGRETQLMAERLKPA
jgi:hypothetical protein